MKTNHTQRNLASMNVGLLAMVMVFGLLLNQGAAQAAQLSGLLIDDYSTSFQFRNPSNSINGSATRDSGNATDNFMANAKTGTITWSLNGRATLNTIGVYNYRETVIPQSRGAQSIIVSISNDYGLTFTSLGTFTAAPAPLPVTSSNTPTTFNLGTVSATNVKFNITSNYGDSGFVGLNEVEFFGTPARTPVQVPITVTAKSSEFAGRPATGAADGIFETIDTTKMWMSNGSDNLPTITFSLGARPVKLDHLNVWNYNEFFPFTSRGLDTIQIQLFDASMTSLGLAVDDADGDTTFALNESNGKHFTDPTPSFDGNSLVDTLGIRNAPLASFFKIITLTNPNGAGFGGLTEVQAFIIPEPASLGLLMVGGGFLVRRRRA